eukprot:GEMP01090141.1.p1 GENE.GEMP01090141.1~~GEMP01090141.1.p1  ORF type:complete len:222 (+),score=60.58 GEMP01090141.1:191-856(+)
MDLVEPANPSYSHVRPHGSASTRSAWWGANTKPISPRLFGYATSSRPSRRTSLTQQKSTFGGDASLRTESDGHNVCSVMGERMHRPHWVRGNGNRSNAEEEENTQGRSRWGGTASRSARKQEEGGGGGAESGAGGASGSRVEQRERRSSVTFAPKLVEEKTDFVSTNAAAYNVVADALEEELYTSPPPRPPLSPNKITQTDTLYVKVTSLFLCHRLGKMGQ